MIKPQHFQGPKPFSIYEKYPHQSRKELAKELKDCCLSFGAVDKFVSFISPIPKARREQGDKLVLRAIEQSRHKALASSQSWLKVAEFCKGEERLLRYLFDKPKQSRKTALRWIVDTRDVKALYALWPHLPPGGYEREHIAVGKGGIGEWTNHGWGVKMLEKDGRFFAGDLTFFQPSGKGCLFKQDGTSIPVRCEWKQIPKSEIILEPL